MAYKLVYYRTIKKYYCTCGEEIPEVILKRGTYDISVPPRTDIKYKCDCGSFTDVECDVDTGLTRNVEGSAAPVIVLFEVNETVNPTFPLLFGAQVEDDDTDYADLTVTVDLTEFGGSSEYALSHVSGNEFEGDFAVPADQDTGTYTITCTAEDPEGNTDTATDDVEVEEGGGLCSMGFGI